MPDGADAERRECRTTRHAKGRFTAHLPDHARYSTADRGGAPPFTRSVAIGAVWHFGAVWHARRSAFAPFGISRRLASAPFGIRAVWHPRRLAFRAVWHFAPSGISRRLAFRAVWHFAPSGISRLLGAAQFGSAVPIKPLCYS